MSRELRTKSIKVRLTPSELEQLKQRQVGDNLAQWVRDVCLANPIQGPKKLKRQSKVVRVADPDLLRELAKIGGNLNQIARHANTYDDRIEKLKAFRALASIESQLDELLERYK